MLNAQDMTLNQVLASLGYTTSRSVHYTKHIHRDASIAFTGSADAVWAWLHETKQIGG